ncbi:xylose repressor [Arthrobacter sp. Hiyo8]|nr:xylose repressor [Arthrobacter sp. Hiyo8]
MNSGLVGPAGEASSSGGRPPSRFAFNPAARVVLAVDVGATHVIVAVTDLGGTVLAERRLAQEVADGPEVVLGRVVAEGRELLTEAGRSLDDLAGIGIGLPGPVEHDTGRPIKPPIMPGWDGFDVVRYMQRSLPVPVLVDNDVNIMALGERTAYWPDHDNLLFIKIATGIGAGIISSGELQRGANGTAGTSATSGFPAATTCSAVAGTTAALRHSPRDPPSPASCTPKDSRPATAGTCCGSWPRETSKPSRHSGRPDATLAMSWQQWSICSTLHDRDWRQHGGGR